MFKSIYNIFRLLYCTYTQNQSLITCAPISTKTTNGWSPFNLVGFNCSTFRFAAGADHLLVRRFTGDCFDYRLVHFFWQSFIKVMPQPHNVVASAMFCGEG